MMDFALANIRLRGKELIATAICGPQFTDDAGAFRTWIVDERGTPIRNLKALKVAIVADALEYYGETVEVLTPATDQRRRADGLKHIVFQLKFPDGRIIYRDPGAATKIKMLPRSQGGGSGT